MTKEELKDKYSAFIAEISEIMGLGKPIDILKLCATTDLFFRPLENRIADLEKENEELKTSVENLNKSVQELENKLIEKVTLESLDVVSAKINELEKENAELKKTYRKQRNKRIDELQKENARLTTNEKSLIAERKIIVKENAEAKNLIEELASSLSVVGECGEEECELINKAQKFINKPIF